MFGTIYPRIPGFLMHVYFSPHFMFISWYSTLHFLIVVDGNGNDAFPHIRAMLVNILTLMFLIN